MTAVETASAAETARTHRRSNPALIADLRQSVDPLAALGIVALLGGLVGGWLQPALSRSMRATDLPIGPSGGFGGLLTWGLLLLIASLLAVAGSVPQGSRHRILLDLAALLSVVATVGFLAKSCLVGGALQERLRRDVSDMADLQRIVGYRIPRPSLTTLGPVPLSTAVAELLSALRWGFYLSLVGAVLLLVATRRRQLPGATRTPRGRRAIGWAVALVGVVFAITAGRTALAEWALHQAADSAAQGDDQSAVAQYESVLGDASGAGWSPDLLAQYGTSQLRLGPADGVAARTASSRLQLQAGKDLPALQIMALATQRWPDNLAVRDEFTEQAFEYLRSHGTPGAVRILVTSTNDSALVRIALARYELAAGDNPTAMRDARAAVGLADDNDVRSIALTILSVAQSRSGDLIEGRQTLLAAVNADEDYVNVMARSILTGLYTTLPL